jgi:hypothetical protein
MPSNDTSRNPPPFLDKREITGLRAGAEAAENIGKAKAKANQNRGVRNTRGRRDAMGLANALNARRQEDALDGVETPFRVQKLNDCLYGCCSQALYRKHRDNEAQYITANYCQQRLCPICNAERKRLLRRKWLSYIKRNDHLRRLYDFFHVTLTVEHSVDGRNGKGFYLDELLAKFNELRRLQFWKDNVFGGEYAVEVTKRQNGLHIHIHVLALVRKYQNDEYFTAKTRAEKKAVAHKADRYAAGFIPQNRNRFKFELLSNWSRITADKTATKGEFSEARKQGLAKSLAFTENEKFRLAYPTLTIERALEQIDPRGSTLVGVNNLYYYDAEAGKRVYVGSGNSFDPDVFSRGIMECLKYHFEPFLLKDEDGAWNVDLIYNLAPHLYKRRLYGKFGGFYGVSELNLNDNETTVEEAERALAELADEVVHHPLTGELTTDFSYVIMDAAKMEITGGRDGPLRVRFRKPPPATAYAQADNLRGALRELLLTRRRRSRREPFATPNENEICTDTK